MKNVGLQDMFKTIVKAFSILTVLPTPKVQNHESDPPKIEIKGFVGFLKIIL